MRMGPAGPAGRDGPGKPALPDPKGIAGLHALPRLRVTPGRVGHGCGNAQQQRSTTWKKRSSYLRQGGRRGHRRSWGRPEAGAPISGENASTATALDVPTTRRRRRASAWRCRPSLAAAWAGSPPSLPRWRAQGGEVELDGGGEKF